MIFVITQLSIRNSTTKIVANSLTEDMTWMFESANVVTLRLVTSVDKAVRVGSSTVAKWNIQ